ncbi:hypothetical protein PWR63_00790 [Paraburkholderia sp. A2WS-5]|uniref:hypothetical protein n=1 Tax=unclassified Paraburkholderia TaxID=2615204 RepID=UPI003B7D99DC
MLRFTYPCTTVDAWSRIIDALDFHRMAGVVPSDPILDRSTWRFETRIQRLTSAQEMLLAIKFSCDKDIAALLT